MAPLGREPPPSAGRDRSFTQAPSGDAVGGRDRAFTDTVLKYTDEGGKGKRSRCDTPFWDGDDAASEDPRHIPRHAHMVPQRAHPELAAPRGIPKCEPAICPHAYTREKELECYSEVLERTVTPEAHKYFRRIVQVTQSELEKLLVYKIQQLFDPVTASAVAHRAVKDLGIPVSSKLQLPGVRAAAHLAEMDRKRTTSFQRESTTHQKAVAEGEHLTKHLVGMLGRIMVDFGRFADTILKWQTVDSQGPETMSNDVNSFPLTTLQEEKPGVQDCIGTNSNVKSILERLERQDQENSALESKYNSVSNELRENRRSFMRERVLWREHVSRMKNALKRSTDPNLKELLNHDVEFFSGGDHAADEEDIEEVKQRYEARISQLQEEYEDEIAELKDMVQKLKNKIQALQEKPVKKDEEDKIRELEKKKKELEELVEHLEAEALALRLKLAEAEAANKDLEDQLSNAQASLTEELSRPPQVVEAPKPEQRDWQVQASPKDWGSWRKETPSRLKIDIPPSEGEESAALRAHIKQLEEELALQRGLADRRLQDLEASTKELAEAKQAFEELQKEFRDAASQWEKESRDRATQTQKMLEDARKRPASSSSMTQTDAPDAEQDLRLRVRELEKENAHLKHLLMEAQMKIAELGTSLAEARKRIQFLEDDLAQRPTVGLEVKHKPPMASKGGGWKSVKSKMKVVMAAQTLTPGDCMVDFHADEISMSIFHRHGSGSASPRSPSPPQRTTTVEEEKPYRKDSEGPVRKNSEGKKTLAKRVRGSTLDFRPALDTLAGGVENAVSFIKQTQAMANINSSAPAAIGSAGVPACRSLAGSAQQAVSNISLPISGYDGEPLAQRPRSAGRARRPAGTASSSDLRASYGGGFTVLDSTAWKGADHGELPGDQWLYDRPDSEVARAPSASEDEGEVRPPSSIADAPLHHLASSTQAASCRPPVVKSRSTPDLATAAVPPQSFAQYVATAEPERMRLPRPHSASSLPVPARLSLLHGPPDRKGRPQSALQVGPAQSRPQSAISRPSRPQSAAAHQSGTSRPQSAAAQRPLRPQSALAHQTSRPQSAVAKQRPHSAGGCYGSAIFDGHR